MAIFGFLGLAVVLLAYSDLAAAACSYETGELTCTGVTVAQFLEARSTYADSTMTNISITASQLGTIPTGMFDSGKETWNTIERIVMNTCQITAIEPNAFSYLAANTYIPLNITFLDLSSNQIATFAGATLTIPALEVLMLQENLIESIGNGILFPQLQALNISHNRISTLQPEVFIGVENLQQLDVSYNNDCQIQLGAFSSLPVLTKLVLTNNSVEATYGTFTGLRTLQILEAAKNKIDVRYLTPLKALQQLELDFNTQATLQSIASIPHLLPSLSEISMYNVTDWWCTNLNEIVADFQSKRINVISRQHPTTLTTNVNGIACRE